jgi:hypothetical protein
MRNLTIAASTLASMLIAGVASAEDAAASGSSSANVGVSLPGASQPAAAAPAAAATPGTSDHAQMVGRLAVGYFGIATMGAGSNLTTGSGDTPYLVTGPAPVVGVRYWINPMIGIDAGLGMSIVGGTLQSDVPGAPDVKRNSFTAFLIHGGVPLALASADHFTFEVIPEVNLGFGSAKDDPNGPGTTPMTEGERKHSGFHFDLGARIGAEIHFGFIKLPQLSLIGSVGLRFDSDSGSTTDSQPPAPAADIKTSSSRSEFHTTVGSNPWAIFTDNVAALYYF